jgi:phage terminase large subunit
MRSRATDNQPFDAQPFDLAAAINPTERQREFLADLSDYQYLFYGGAGGGGKSYILRWALLALLIFWASDAGGGHQGVRVGLFSKDYPTLKDRQVTKISREFPPELGELREDGKEGLGFYLHPWFGGGAILLRNLDDPAKYRSAEFAAIAVDELTEHPEQTFHDLRFRLRWPGIEDTKFLAASNPGGIGHSWVKRLWISREFPPELREKAHEFKYVRAMATDNPHNAQSYLRELNSLPAAMRAAVRDGSWDIFIGQMFGEFRRDVHVCEPFPIPHWWKRWLANDPGHHDPGVWLWFAVSDADKTVYVYRELTFVGETQKSYGDQAAAALAAMTREEHDAAGQLVKIVERMDYGVTGMDAFQKDKAHGTNKSIEDHYVANGMINWRRPDHGVGCRKRRASTVHEYLKLLPNTGRDRDVQPYTSRVKIFNTCTRLIETLPSVPVDENDRDVVADCDIDHWYDAFGYGLQSRHQTQSVTPLKQQYPAGTVGHDILKLGEPKKAKGAWEQ